MLRLFLICLLSAFSGVAQAATLPSEFDPTGRDWALSGADDFAGNTITNSGGLEVAALWEVTTGSDQIVIALPVAPDWRDDQLRLRWWLNRGELGGLRAPRNDRSAAVCTTWIASSSDPWDINNDGSFNVEDYACDLRVDPAAAGLTNAVDPGDLLASTLADGIDQDGSGLVDDIAGWLPTTAYAGQATGTWWQIVAAEADGRETVGVCPRCRIVPVPLPDRLSVAEAARVIAWLQLAGVTTFGEWQPERWSLATRDNPLWQNLTRGLVFVWLENNNIVLPLLEQTVPVVPGRPDALDPALASRYDMPAACQPGYLSMSARIPATDCARETLARAAGLAGLLQSAYLQSTGKHMAGSLVAQYFALTHGNHPSGERMARRARSGWQLPQITWATPAAEAWWSSRRQRQVTAAIDIAAISLPYNYELALETALDKKVLETRLRTQGDNRIRQVLVADLFERSSTSHTDPEQLDVTLTLSDGERTRRVVHTQWRLHDRRLASGFPVAAGFSVLTLWGEKNGIWVVGDNGDYFRVDLEGKKGRVFGAPVASVVAVAAWRRSNSASSAIEEAAWLTTDQTVTVANWKSSKARTVIETGFATHAIAVAQSSDQSRLVIVSGSGGVRVFDALDGSIPPLYSNLVTVTGTDSWWSPPAVGDIDGDGWPDLVFWSSGFGSYFGIGDTVQLIFYLTGKGRYTSHPLLTGQTAEAFNAFVQVGKRLWQPFVRPDGSFAASVVPGISVSGQYTQGFSFAPGTSWQIPAWTEEGTLLTPKGNCFLSSALPCDFGLDVRDPFPGAPIITMHDRHGRKLLAVQETTGWQIFDQKFQPFDRLSTGRATRVFHWFDAQNDGLLDLTVASLQGDVALYRTAFVGMDTTVESASQGPEANGWLSPGRFVSPSPGEGFGCTLARGASAWELILLLLLVAGSGKILQKRDDRLNKLL